MPDVIHPITDPAFWRERVRVCDGELHRVLYHVSIDQWTPIEEHHRRELAKHIRPGDVVLDAGCGYGRLLDLLPSTWEGAYWGVDLSPDLLKLAVERHPGHNFYHGDLRRLPAWFKLDGPCFDWAVLISIKQMVIDNLGEGEWQKMLVELKSVAKNLLLLEYDEVTPALVVRSE